MRGIAGQYMLRILFGRKWIRERTGTGAGGILVSTGTRDACLTGVPVGFMARRRNNSYYIGCVCSSVCTKERS